MSCQPKFLGFGQILGNGLDCYSVISCAGATWSSGAPWKGRKHRSAGTNGSSRVPRCQRGLGISGELHGQLLDSTFSSGQFVCQIHKTILHLLRQKICVDRAKRKCFLFTEKTEMLKAARNVARGRPWQDFATFIWVY